MVVGQWEVRYNCQDGRLSFPATAEGKQEVDNKSDYLEPGHELLRERGPHTVIRISIFIARFGSNAGWT